MKKVSSGKQSAIQNIYDKKYDKQKKMKRITYKNGTGFLVEKCRIINVTNDKVTFNTSAWNEEFENEQIDYKEWKDNPSKIKEQIEKTQSILNSFKTEIIFFCTG